MNAKQYQICLNVSVAFLQRLRKKQEQKQPGPIHLLMARRSATSFEVSSLTPKWKTVFFTLIGWIWNAKDHLKAWAKNNGKDHRQLDKEMHQDSDLSVCSKLANELKHGDFEIYHFGIWNNVV